jgi:hypothetical protein
LLEGALFVRPNLGTDEDRRHKIASQLICSQKRHWGEKLPRSERLIKNFYAGFILEFRTGTDNMLFTNFV